LILLIASNNQQIGTSVSSYYGIETVIFEVSAADDYYYHLYRFSSNNAEHYIAQVESS
jgi:hypothetical protein